MTMVTLTLQETDRRAERAERHVRTESQRRQQAERRAEIAESARRDAETTVCELQISVQTLQQTLEGTRRVRYIILECIMTYIIVFLRVHSCEHAQLTHNVTFFV